MTICCLHRHHPIYVTTVHHQEGDIDSGDGDALLLQSIPSTSAIFTMITITTILPVPPWPLLPSSAWLDQLYCPAINFDHFCHVAPHTSSHLITHAYIWNCYKIWLRFETSENKWWTHWHCSVPIPPPELNSSAFLRPTSAITIRELPSSLHLQPPLCPPPPKD